MKHLSDTTVLRLILYFFAKLSELLARLVDWRARAVVMQIFSRWNLETRPRTYNLASFIVSLSSLRST